MPGQSNTYLEIQLDYIIFGGMDVVYKEPRTLLSLRVKDFFITMALSFSGLVFLRFKHVILVGSSTMKIKVVISILVEKILNWLN